MDVSKIFNTLDELKDYCDATGATPEQRKALYEKWVSAKIDQKPQEASKVKTAFPREDGAKRQREEDRINKVLDMIKDVQEIEPPKKTWRGKP